MKNCMKIKNKEKVQSFESQQPYPFKKSFMHQGVHLAPDLLVTAADSSAGGLDEALQLPTPARRLATGLEISPDVRQWQGIS